MHSYFCCKKCAKAHGVKMFNHSQENAIKKKQVNHREKNNLFVKFILLLWCSYIPDVTNGFVMQEKGNPEYYSDAVGLDSSRGIRNAPAEALVDTPDDVRILAPSVDLHDESLTSNEKKVSEENSEVTSTQSSSNIDDTDSDTEDDLITKRKGWTPPVKDTSIFRIGKDAQGTPDEGNIKSIASPGYLNKVVVLQKPFHFHIPILSSAKTEALQQQASKEGIVTTGRIVYHSQNANGKEKLKASGLPKREIQSSSNQSANTTASEAASSESHENGHHEEVELERLLRQYPKLIPSDNRKRNSGKNHSHHEHLEEETHHLLGVRSTENEDDDFVEPTDTYQNTPQRNVKKTVFSQDLVNSILGHKDDLVTYREKIRERAKALGIKPEAVFNSTVYGIPSYKRDSVQNKTNDIYQSRLKFHELFLDDPSESEKYHYNEILNQDKQQSSKQNKGVFNAYMGILKRSKRGLKTWIKKLIGRKREVTTPTKPTSPTTTTHSPKKRLKKTKNSTVKVYEQTVDEHGDSPVDLLLPTALRRSSYSKRREEMRRMEKEEKEFEEEYEKSEEIEPKVREEGGDEEVHSANADGAVDKDVGEKNENAKNSSSVLRVKRSIVDGHVDFLETSKLKVISKDEMLLVLEMAFNLAQYQCVNLKASLMEGLLAMTQAIVEWSSLPDYIAERRDDVDQIFSEMLDCSSDIEKSVKLADYKVGTSKSNMKDILGVKVTSVEAMSAYEKTLRRSKRVRRGENYLSEVELTKSSGELKNTAHDRNEKEPSTKNEDNEAVVGTTKGLLKFYIILHEIVSETCSTMDKQLLHDLYLIFVKEISKIQNRGDYNKKIQNLVKYYHVDIYATESLIAECYEEKM